MRFNERKINWFNRLERLFKDEIAYFVDILSANPGIELSELKLIVSNNKYKIYLNDILEYLVYKEFKHPIVENVKIAMIVSRPNFYN